MWVGAKEEPVTGYREISYEKISLLYLGQHFMDVGYLLTKGSL